MLERCRTSERNFLFLDFQIIFLIKFHWFNEHLRINIFLYRIWPHFWKYTGLKLWLILLWNLIKLISEGNAGVHWFFWWGRLTLTHVDVFIWTWSYFLSVCMISHCCATSRLISHNSVAETWFWILWWGHFNSYFLHFGFHTYFSDMSGISLKLWVVHIIIWFETVIFNLIYLWQIQNIIFG